MSSAMPPNVAQAAILINAPIALIWSIMLDLAAYPEWNPFIVLVTDIPPHLTVGSEITLHVNFSNGMSTTSREAVTDIVPPYVDGSAGVRKAVFAYRFAGTLPPAAIVNGTRYQWLEQKLGGDATLYRTEEAFTGPGAALVPVAEVQDGFERHAHALKSRAETLAGC